VDLFPGGIGPYGIPPEWENGGRRRARSVDWVSVVSSVFSAAAYDPDRGQLYLRFHSGKVYRYLEFPPEQYDEFLAADSKGRYFARHIRGQFRDEEVRELTYFSGK
jgi:hypothetical protein